MAARAVAQLFPDAAALPLGKICPHAEHFTICSGGFVVTATTDVRPDLHLGQAAWGPRSDTRSPILGGSGGTIPRALHGRY
jgi:hypothetical protein